MHFVHGYDELREFLTFKHQPYGGDREKHSPVH